MTLCNLLSFIFIIATVATSQAYSFPKVQCSFRDNDTDCEDVIQRYTVLQKTKLVYLHLRYVSIQENSTIRNETIYNEYVWINKSSEYFLSYPDDFHPLTFGILADNMFEIDVNIEMEFNGSARNSTHSFLRMVLNVTIGEVCRRNYYNHTGREFFANFNIWIGYDYLCFSKIDEKNKEVSKLTLSNILISILGFMCILWFPLIFVVMDQNKSHMNRKYSELRYFGKRISDNHKTASLLAQNNILSESIISFKDESNEFNHNDTYDEGDVPYGIQRVLIVCFHSNVSKEVSMILSYCRFVILLLVIMAATAGVILSYIIDHIPPDLKDTTRYPVPNDKAFAVHGILATFLYLLFILCFFLPVAFKNYTYSCDICGFLKGGPFLRKMYFSDILESRSNKNIFYTMITRFFIIFSINLWIRSVYIPFVEWKFKSWNKMKRIVTFLPCVIAMLSNIIFQLIWTFPFIWCFFVFILNVFNLLYKSLTNCKCMKRKYSKMGLKLILSALVFSTLVVLALVILFNASSIIIAIPCLVKMICYTCFIVLPQVSFSIFRMIFSILTLISYCIKLYKTMTDLYKELLKMIFKLHEENQLDSRFVKIAEFDYVAAHVFPFRVQLFYFITKVFLTSVLFFVAIEPFFYLDLDETYDDMPLNGMISFFFILFSPALAEFIFNSSPESKVMSNKHEILRLVMEWQNLEKIKNEDVVHSCDCFPHCKGSKRGKVFTTCMEGIFGCCFKFTSYDDKKYKFCQLCRISFQNEKTDSNTKSKDTKTSQRRKTRKVHFIAIECPEFVLDKNCQGNFQGVSDIQIERNGGEGKEENTTTQPTKEQSDESSL
ncbi:hypothetical protein FSP39_005900 [Pinctada imbricata]|uniref:Uncharacterized protein n=1 Tax=Pinctada imbricata TaxID=66713 RepID=A0AA88XZG9_PINIB|nr:hypothetical protein FSP39_005900 [Pinctada imbricata]